LIVRRIKQANSRFRRQAEGGAAVEFGIVLPILTLLMLGGMDLGHMFYMQHIITNASREGARYAALYTGNANPPSNVESYIKTTLGYSSYNFDHLTVSQSLSTGSPKVITVTVQANKSWWILGSVLGLDNPKQLTGRTAMVWQGP
jgi:Flp pilus assembly protein TadG